ncbi:hypothetical protein, partial [Acinetobacter baumannii]
MKFDYWFCILLTSSLAQDHFAGDGQLYTG